MSNDLSKTEKRLARELIEKGLKQEYEKAITDIDAVIENWKSKKANNRDTYQDLYRTLLEHNKHIAVRYDGMSGSRYLMAVGEILADGLITKEDIAGFSEDHRAQLMRYLSLISE